MDGRSARDVVLKLALGELDAAFRRAEEVRESLDLAAAKVEGALQVLPEAGLRFAAQVGECTKQAKLELTQFIEKRANSTLSTAVDSARAQMRDAAVLAFSEQLTPIVRDVARQVEQVGSSIKAANELARWSYAAAGLLVGLALGGAAALLLR